MASLCHLADVINCSCRRRERAPVATVDSPYEVCLVPKKHFGGGDKTAPCFAMLLMNPQVVAFTCMPIKYDTCPRVVGLACLTEKRSHEQRPAVSSNRRIPVLDAYQVDHFPSNPTLYYIIFFFLVPLATAMTTAATRRPSPTCWCTKCVTSSTSYRKASSRARCSRREGTGTEDLRSSLFVLLRAGGFGRGRLLPKSWYTEESGFYIVGTGQQEVLYLSPTIYLFSDRLSKLG